MSLEKVIFNNLINNEDYGRKVIPFLKKEYFQARERLKRSRSVPIDLHELGNESDDERESPKVMRSKFPNLNNE